LARSKAQEKTKQQNKLQTSGKKSVGGTMSDPLYAFPTVCEQTLRGRWRAVFHRGSPVQLAGGSITYAGATN